MFRFVVFPFLVKCARTVKVLALEMIKYRAIIEPVLLLNNSESVSHIFVNSRQPFFGYPKHTIAASYIAEEYTQGHHTQDRVK